jgi:predicted DNA-binding protein with PD1-like motif
MQSNEEHGIIVARLFGDEDVFQSLKEICLKHEVETAIILSAIGQIKQFTLGFFNGKEYLSQDFVNTHELLSIQGMISRSREQNDYQFHLHAVVGNEEKQTFGGHLFKGKVQVTNEIVILKTHIKVKRRKEETGLLGLYLE